MRITEEFFYVISRNFLCDKWHGIKNGTENFCLIFIDWFFELEQDNKAWWDAWPTFFSCKMKKWHRVETSCHLPDQKIVKIKIKRRKYSVFLADSLFFAQQGSVFVWSNFSAFQMDSDSVFQKTFCIGLIFWGEGIITKTQFFHKVCFLDSELSEAKFSMCLVL